MPIIIVILIISFLIIIHELGHYWAARKANIKVEEFGIGYPPKLFKFFSWKGTDFTFNIIPFGGFVKLEGEAGPEDINDQEVQSLIAEQKKNPKKQGPFFAKTPYQKMRVILAGTFVNLIFAVIAFAIVFSLQGIPVSLSDQARIGQIIPDSPASEARLPENVNIVEIRVDNLAYQVISFIEVQKIVNENLGQTLTMIVSQECDGLYCPSETQTFDVYARPVEERPEGQGAIGIIFMDAVFHFYPWYEMPFRGTWHGLKQAVAFGYLILSSLGNMVTDLVSTGTMSDTVAGPVGIVYETQQGNVISDNHLHNLGFAGMLSLNLAIINLLPIPALDGGRALFIFLEKIFGQKKINKLEQYASLGGFALLIILIISITINDISRIIRG